MSGILIVEDEPLVSSYIAHVLKEFAYEIAGCSSSGTEAIALAEESRPKLAVVDIQLSGAMDGIEAAAILQNRFGVLTIFLSGIEAQETMERARAIRPIAILRKPFLPSQLLDAIQQVLSPRPAASEDVGTPMLAVASKP